MRTPILVPSSGPDDWRRFLSKPKLQWKSGFSARTLAHSWEDSQGLPDEVREVLEALLPGPIEPLLIIPEYKVDMPGRGAASQNDIFVLCRAGRELAVIMVEGKVDEPFGPTLGEWMENGSEGKQARLTGLCECLRVAPPSDMALRYQLFHRTASAILEARRMGAAHAIMLVHSFSPAGLWRDDFSRFVSFLGTDPGNTDAISVSGHSDPELSVAWVSGQSRYLKS